jgi:Skp family chaperone for outer membrane proteins
MRQIIPISMLISFLVTVGCSSAKIAALESLGYAKREQLVSRVDDARDSQVKAKKQFESALAEFLAVTGGAETRDLESRYARLRSSFERSEDRAEDVRSRISEVERVSEALFKEWRRELDEYSNESMRSASSQQLDETRGQYDRLISVMKSASSRMDPVLAAFKDQVLFLKHNLNARAIASLQGTAATIQTDVSGLVREMEASINEADAFIKQMKGTESGG